MILTFPKVLEVWRLGPADTDSTDLKAPDPADGLGRSGDFRPHVNTLKISSLGYKTLNNYY
jgi:hypothetical protein